MSLVNVCKSPDNQWFYWLVVTDEAERFRFTRACERRGWSVRSTHSKTWLIVNRGNGWSHMSDALSLETARELVLEAAIPLGGADRLEDIPDIYWGTTPPAQCDGSIYTIGGSCPQDNFKKPGRT